MISIPVLLVDEVLPTLRDTELRLLIVVLRQTHIAGHERSTAWLTHSELKKRTGRASEAISEAVKSLVALNLIVVTDESGCALKTPSSRQLAVGKRFYKAVNINPQVLKQDEGKPKSIENNKLDIYPFRFCKHEDDIVTRQRIELEKENIRKRFEQFR